MPRIGLRERLNRLGPEVGPSPLLMKGVSLVGYARMLHEKGQEYSMETYRLMRCADAKVDLKSMLCDALYHATKMSAANGDRIVYDILVRPFVKLFEEEEKHG